MIVAAHQPTYLPGVSVMAKVARADTVVWLDTARFTTPGYVNRNQLPDGTWLTVPVERRDHRSTIREVTIAGEEWQGPQVNALREYFGDAYDPDFGGILAGPLGRAGEPLLELNLGLISWMLAGFGLRPRQLRQSEYPSAGGSLSAKVVRMVKEVGGTTYLSGPTDRLDAAEFAAAGLELAFFEFAGDNPTALAPLLSAGELPTGAGGPRQHVRAA